MQLPNLAEIHILCFCFGKHEFVFCGPFIKFIEALLKLALNCLGIRSERRQRIKENLFQVLDT